MRSPAAHQQLAPEHLLKVLLEEKDGLSRALIQSAGGRPDEADKAMDAALSKMPKVEGGSGQLYMKPETARVFADAEQGAKDAGDAFVTTERLLIAIAKEGGDAAKALKAAGATEKALEDAATAIRKGKTADSASAEEGYDALKRYARDLTQAARDGKLDPVIGRDEEIRRTIQVLSPPHQEQPRPDRRARRRQDRHRRGPGPAHRQRRRARELEGQAAHGARHGLADRRREVPRRVRGAAEGCAQ